MVNVQSLTRCKFPPEGRRLPLIRQVLGKQNSEPGNWTTGREWFAAAAADRLKCSQKRQGRLVQSLTAVLNQRADATEWSHPGQVLDTGLRLRYWTAEWLSQPRLPTTHGPCPLSVSRLYRSPFGPYRAILEQRSRNWTGTAQTASYSVCSYNTLIGRPLKLPPGVFLNQ